MAGKTPARESRVKSAQKPFQPAPGTDFGKVEEVRAKTHGFVARGFVIGIGGAVGVAGSYGLYTHDYAPITAVWVVAGPIVGGLVSHFFGVKRNNTG